MAPELARPGARADLAEGRLALLPGASAAVALQDPPAGPVPEAVAAFCDDAAAAFGDLEFSDDDGDDYAGDEEGDGAGTEGGSDAASAAERALWQLAPWRESLRRSLSGADGPEPALPCEILPHLLLGDLACAAGLPLLAGLGVTHVLNAAGGEARGAEDYSAVGISYLELDTTLSYT